MPVMKIDRQLGIITVLLQKDKSTAPELARRFEVSPRTILRDVDDLCRAGIPVVTLQGGDGGISIAEGYRLDKSVLTVEELDHIIAGLRGIGSVTDESRMKRLVDKLSPGGNGVISMRDSIVIDLSSHYRGSLTEKISLIKSAISGNRLIRFDYYSPKGVEERTVEPCFITFRWTSWYVFGFCRDRAAYRLFKLNRLWALRKLEEAFLPAEIPEEELRMEDCFSDEKKTTLLFDKSAEYLLVDDYGPGSYEQMVDGRLKMTVGYTNREYMIRWILGFGDRVSVLEPEELANEIRDITKKTLKNYREHDI